MIEGQKVKDRIKGNGRTRLDNESSESGAPENIVTGQNTKATVEGPQELLFNGCRRSNCDISDTQMLTDVVTPFSDNFSQVVASEGGANEHVRATELSENGELFEATLKINPECSPAFVTSSTSTPSPVIHQINSNHVEFKINARGDSKTQLSPAHS